MSPSRLELKRASGWFAAGAEVLQAAMLVSDGAFKVFVWICLNAERTSGRLRVAVADLARALRKTEADIQCSLDELHQAGVCRFTPGLIEIQDHYWPYHRIASAPVSNDLGGYLSSVRRLFLSHACVRSVFSPADRQIAAGWYGRGISVDHVERAMNLGVARKYIALMNHRTGTPITTLRYFESLIEEVGDAGSSPDYWRYVAMRCAQFERQWQALRSGPNCRSAGPMETK